MTRSTQSQAEPRPRFYAFCQTGLVGRLTLTSDGEALTGCWFENDRHYAGAEAGLAHDEGLAAFAPARDWLARYAAGERPSPGELFLRPRGTDYQRAVWEELLAIPYGEVSTYGAVAAALEARLGRRQSCRAVGAAVGRNPLCVIVPCHRVVGADGGLTGFAGGVDLKAALLAHEGVAVSDRGRVHLLK